MAGGNRLRQAYGHRFLKLSAARILVSLFALAGCSGKDGTAASDGGQSVSVPAAAALDATGTWTGSFKSTSPAASGGFDAQISQTGGKLSGTISIPLINVENVAISGSVSGANLAFSDVGHTISFNGTAAADDTATGSFTVTAAGGKYQGTWTAQCYRMLTLLTSFPASGEGGMAWDGSALWITDTQGLVKVDGNGATEVRFGYNDLENPYHDFVAVAWDGTTLWAAEDLAGPDFTQAFLWKIDRATGRVGLSLPAPPDGLATSSTNGLGLAWDGSNLFCLRNAGMDDVRLYRVDRSSGAGLDTVSIQSTSTLGPLMIGGFGSSGSDLYVTDRPTGTVLKLRTADGHIMRRYQTGLGMGSDLGGVAGDGTRLWVRNNMDNKVYAFTVPSGTTP